MADPIDLTEEMSESSGVVGLIQERMRSAEDGRQSHEERWLKAYKNFRGVYDSSTQYTSTEKSKVFIKITKTKVLAAYGQLVDVIFGANKFPIGISETKVPEGVAEHAHLDTKNPVPGIETPVADSAAVENPFDVGYEGDGRTLKAGATYGTGKFEEQRIEELAEDSLQEGLSPIPEALEISPAQKAARRMEKLIHDQIEESNGASEIRNSLFESALFGTGIVKGPFNFNKTLNRWSSEDGERTYSPVSVRVPRIEFVSIWDFFPDPNATNINEAEYIFHRHRMNRTKLRSLAKMPYFNKDAIREALVMGPNYEEKDYEQELKDDNRSEEAGSGQFEVLEYWGVMDAEYARQVGMDIPEEVDDLDEVQVNIWTCGTYLLRAVLNPFTPYRIPYHAFPYERNPYNFFGIGVAENMDDSQQIMNGHARMAIDNLAMSGSLVFDVDESALEDGQ